MKNQETKKSKKKVLLYYLILAACLLIIAAVTITVIFTVKAPANNPSIDSGQNQPDDGDNKDPDDGNGGQTSVDTSYLSPVKSVALANVFDLFHNETLGWYYRHEGYDFEGKVGDEVYAMQDGTVTKVEYSDSASSVLYGGYLTIDHGNGVISTYKFIDIAKGIGQGTEVKRGQVIGTIAQPSGTETFVGAHLHLEIEEDGETVDPETFLEIIGK